MKQKKQLQHQKEINLAIDMITKEFGEEVITNLANGIPKDIAVFSSGSYLINQALGINGYPKGRIIEIFGPESSGKTTLALHAILEIQKQKGIAAFIDAEHAIDPRYAKDIGIDLDNLILSQPNSGEQALEITHTLIKTKCIDLIVVDSVAALVPKEELENGMDEQTMGAQARMMSKALRKITASLTSGGTTIIFINQVREKIGVYFGNPEVTPGGRALKFFSSIRLEVRRGAIEKDGTKPIGNIIKIKIVKNKLAPPYQTAETEIVYSKGISQVLEIIRLAETYEIILKKGSWYKYNDKNIAQGKANLKAFFENNPNIFKEIEKKVLKLLFKK